MSHSNSPSREPHGWPAVTFRAHPTGEQLVDYVDRRLEEGVAAKVHEHVVFCDECASWVATYRREVAFTTGFDPITGERVHAGLRFAVTTFAAQIETLAGFKPPARLPTQLTAEFAQAADDERHKPESESFSGEGVEVKLFVTNGLMHALVLTGSAPVQDAEVRLELTDPEDRQFELYAWGTTDQHGLASLGPARPFESFATGHRFTLGVLLP